MHLTLRTGDGGERMWGGGGPPSLTGGLTGGVILSGLDGGPVVLGSSAWAGERDGVRGYRSPHLISIVNLD